MDKQRGTDGGVRGYEVLKRANGNCCRATGEKSRIVAHTLRANVAEICFYRLDDDA